ncbi:endodeoxyribonuclease [Butyrivibrio virus Arian]|nr:endodeoxyribonuclease [Butyrivibrio virus Arian]
MIKFNIPLEPISKKNSQRILLNPRTRKPFIMPSEKYKQYERDTAYYMNWFKAWDKPINTPVNIKCEFYMKTRRRVDLTNLLEAIDDILVKHGVLEDDNYNIIVSHDGSRVYYDKENPRTVVEITAAEDAPRAAGEKAATGSR